MNRARFEALFSGLNAMAKKVYGAVPAAEPWTVNQIVTELVRLRISLCDFRTVAGCINTLVKTGLVREIQRGMFIREEVRDKPKPQPKEEPMPTKPVVATSTTPQPAKEAAKPASSPLDKLSSLSTHLAQIAKDLATVQSAIKSLTSNLDSLTSNLDTAALEIEEMFATRDTETDKLRQVLSTLKSLAI